MSGQFRGNNTHLLILDLETPVHQIMDEVNLAIREHGLMFREVTAGVKYAVGFELVKVEQ